MSPPVEFADQLELFHGEATVRLARVYARFPSVPGCTLSGYLSGPHCLHSTTLPATIPFRDKGPGDSLLAEAIVPDPCFWSPELPALYTAHLELRQGNVVVATSQRSMGMRALSIRGRSFYCEGRRVVLRGAHRQAVQPTDLLAWRDAGATMLVANPPDALCDEASRVGVLLLASLTADEALDAPNAWRLSQHASVSALVVPAYPPLDELRRSAPRLILARMLMNGQRITSDLDADALLVMDDDLQLLGGAASAFDRPIIAVGRSPSMLRLGEARTKCDQLQAALAPYGDFAGYLVSP